MSWCGRGGRQGFVLAGCTCSGWRTPSCWLKMRLLVIPAWSFREYVRPASSIAGQLHCCMGGVKRIDKSATLTTKKVSNVPVLKHGACRAKHWTLVHLFNDGHTPLFYALLSWFNLCGAFFPSVFSRKCLAVHFWVQSPVSMTRDEYCRCGTVPRAASAKHRVVHATPPASWLLLVRRATSPNHRLSQVSLTS